MWEKSLKDSMQCNSCMRTEHIWFLICGIFHYLWESLEKVSLLCMYIKNIHWFLLGSKFSRECYVIIWFDSSICSNNTYGFNINKIFLICFLKHVTEFFQVTIHKRRFISFLTLSRWTYFSNSIKIYHDLIYLHTLENYIIRGNLIMHFRNFQ
jgi:hypothetical protein